MKQTIDNVILQCDPENFSSCLGIADSCPGVKTKEPEFHVQWKPPTIGGSTLPRIYEENKSYHSQPSPQQASLSVLPNLCGKNPGQARRRVTYQGQLPYTVLLVRVLLPTSWLQPTTKPCKCGIRAWESFRNIWAFWKKWKLTTIRLKSKILLRFASICNVCSNFFVLVFIVTHTHACTHIAGRKTRIGDMNSHYDLLWKYITFSMWSCPMSVCNIILISSVQFSCSLVSDSLQPHGLQYWNRIKCVSNHNGINNTSQRSLKWN